MSVAHNIEGLPVHPLTRRQYDAMVEAGVLTDDDKVELLYGVIVPMSPQGAPHSVVVRRLTELLAHRLYGRAHVGSQLPFAASDHSEPEPDLLVSYQDDDSETEHPSRAHLVIEVSRTSQGKDLGPKARVYAEAGVPVYWVVDTERRVVWIHSRPEDGRYTEMTTARTGDTLVVEAFPDVTFPVDAVLPPR